MVEVIKEIIAKEFLNNFNENIEEIYLLPVSGSSRRYYRIFTSVSKSYIATYNQNIVENDVFIKFSEHFLALHLPVAKVLAVSENNEIYFLEDLGSISLFDTILENKENDKHTVDLIKETLTLLVDFQIKAANGFDFNNCFTFSKFDENVIRHDLNYFKFYFLKILGIDINECLIENDFQQIVDYCLSVPSNFFMYRDFQSRNVMICNDKPFFIDFQGGMQGPLQYDLASFLFQARIDLSDDFRNQMIDFYLEQVSKNIKIDKKLFKEQFYVILLVRVLQTLGAYGFRGIFERKEHFIKSIPLALTNLCSIFELLPKDIDVSYLKNICQKIVNSDLDSKLGLKKKLKVKIFSFAYKRGVPIDTSGNGGGYVFDCRSVPNPGIYDEYKPFTGKDKIVKIFFENNVEMKSFLQNIFLIIDAHVTKFITRGFSSLMVSFGCTGGQHRSVYAAEMLFEYLSQKYDIDFELKHIEQDMKKNQEHYLKSAQ